MLLPDAMFEDGGEVKITGLNGWLKKRGRYNKSWNRRYFMVWNKCLMYYFGSISEAFLFFRGESPVDTSLGHIDITKIQKIA